jgi:23S rRNA U2552 (ribose-2'-O)-methylase RlmE/FtsJ
MNKENFLLRLTKYRFEFRHLTLLFGILIGFQILISLVQKSSLQNFLAKTQEWYQKDSAEKMANLTATSLELLIETSKGQKNENPEDQRKIIRAVNIILGQQLLEQSVNEIYVIVSDGKKNYAIKDGSALYSFLFEKDRVIPAEDSIKNETLDTYESVSEEMFKLEKTRTLLKDGKTFQIFVPLLVRGEYIGALYMKNTPDFSYITNEIIAGYDETVVI